MTQASHNHSINLFLLVVLCALSLTTATNPQQDKHPLHQHYQQHDRISSPIIFSNNNHGISDTSKNINMNYRRSRFEYDITAKPAYTCFGKGYSVPSVCSGNGICSAQDICDCTSPYVGLDCSVDPSDIKRSWFNLQVSSSILLLDQSISSSSLLETFVDVSKAAQGTFSSLLYSFGLYNATTPLLLITERLESNISNWKVDFSTAAFNIGNYIVNTTVTETKYNKTVLFSSSLEIVVLDLSSLSDSATLLKLSTRNLKDVLQNMGKQKSEIKKIVKEIAGRSPKSIFEARDISQVYLISSYENRNDSDDELTLMIGSGASNLTTTTLERVKNNVYNESFLIEGVVVDCFNVSSNLLAVKVKDSNNHTSNIQQTLYGSTSTLALIRSDRSEVRLSLELFEIVVTNRQSNFVSGVSIQVPNSVKFSSSTGDVSFSVINYNISVQFPSETNTNPNITSISNVINFRTLRSGSGDYLPLSGLSDPLQFIFNTQNIDSTFISGFNESLFTKNVSCRYWNISISGWDNYGCTTKQLSNNQVQCLCDHTTSFSAFVEYIPINSTTTLNVRAALSTEMNSGLWIVKIVISSLLQLIICSVVIGLIIFRNNQPVKSRSYFPYIGLASLFVWLIFSIASNGTLLNSTSSGSDSSSSSKNSPSTAIIVNNIQVVVTSSLISISVCCYLFVCVRYMFYRYYYEWISFVDSNNKGKLLGKQWFHAMKSNFTLFGLLAIVGIIIVLYFIVLVILRAVGTLDAKQYSLAGSISHFLIMIFLMVCVVSVFVIDFYLDFRSKQISDEMCDLSHEITTIEIETTGGGGGSGGSGNSGGSIGNNSEASAAETADNKNQIHKLKNLFGKNTTPSKVYHYWVTNDRLLFRVDAIFYTVGMLFFIASYSVGFKTLDFRYNTAVMTESQVYQLLTLDSLSYVFEVLMTCCFIMVYGGLAVISSLYFKFATSKTKLMQKRIRNSKTEFAEIYSLLESHCLMRIFKAFCKSEFSLENLSFWLRVFQAKKYQEDWANLAEEQKGKRSWSDFKKEITEWRVLYIQNGSPMSVNISSRTRNSFEHWCNQSEVVDYDSIDKKELSRVIDALETELIYNLLDTYSRFHISEPFKIIKNSTEGREESSGGIFRSIDNR